MWLALRGLHAPALQHPRTSPKHRMSIALGAGDTTMNKTQNSPPPFEACHLPGGSQRKPIYSRNIHQAVELVPGQFQASKKHFLPHFNLKPAELLTPKCRAAHIKPWNDSKGGNVSEVSGTQQLFDQHEPLPQKDRLCDYCPSMVSPFCSSCLTESNLAATSPWI